MAIVNNITDGLVLGFGVIGAVLVGNATHKALKNHGVGPATALATSCAASGLAVAVLPATAVGGAFATAQKLVELANPATRAAIMAGASAQYVQTKAKVLDTADRVVNREERSSSLHTRRSAGAKKPSTKGKATSRARA